MWLFNVIFFLITMEIAGLAKNNMQLVAEGQEGHRREEIPSLANNYMFVGIKFYSYINVLPSNMQFRNILSPYEIKQCTFFIINNLGCYVGKLLYYKSEICETYRWRKVRLQINTSCGFKRSSINLSTRLSPLPNWLFTMVLFFPSVFYLPPLSDQESPSISKFI